MSSAEIRSTTPFSSRRKSIERISPPRIPLTWIVSTSAFFSFFLSSLSAANACEYEPLNSTAETHKARRLFVKLIVFIIFLLYLFFSLLSNKTSRALKLRLTDYHVIKSVNGAFARAPCWKNHHYIDLTNIESCVK